jgi:hypothetical protein
MNHNYNIDYYNYPRKYYKEKSNYELKDINKIKEYEKKLLNNNEIELLPNSIYEYEKNKYYNIRKKIYYDLIPLKKKYNINGGIIFDTYEYNKNVLINELLESVYDYNNSGYRYNYEDGILFKYQYITNCTLCILSKKQLKKYDYKYYNNIKINELNNNKCILISYEDFYKMSNPNEYEYVEYFKNEFDINNTLNNIFHIYWKRIIFLDFHKNIVIKNNNIKSLKCCIKWFIISERNLCYTLINNILDYTINDDTYNKNEYIRYFIENSIYKINEINNEINKNIINIELNESYMKNYNLNIVLNESKINLLNYLNNYNNTTYNFKIDKCDNYVNIIKTIKDNNLKEINNINKRIITLENTEKKTKEEYELLLLNYEYNNLEYILNRLDYIKKDIERNIVRKNKIINQIDYIEKNVKEENIKSCPICFDEIENTYSILDCGHYFCINCSNILNDKYWFNCPNCREKNNSFNYIIKDKIENINNNVKMDNIIEYIKKYYNNDNNKDSNILIISNYKDNLRLLNKTFKKNPKCSFLDRKIKKDSNIFMCGYEKLENINNNEFKEILILEPSLIKSHNELVKYKFNNIMKSYFICKNTLEENLLII